METRLLWKQLVIPPGDQDHLWELFHENSKLSSYDSSLAREKVIEEANKMHESFLYEGLPIVELPKSIIPLTIELRTAIEARRSTRAFVPSPLSLECVGTLLQYSYGRIHSEVETLSGRPSRAVPSAGALYPLEVFFYSGCLQGQQAGFYHYNPCHHHLRLIKHESNMLVMENALVDYACIENCSMLVLITAQFHRSVFKYGDRGYRFILIEAGHVAQNMQLVAQGLGLSSVCIGGFFDRRIDRLLEFDGITHSTVYLVAIGRHEER
jgi:SagB-type dehydrogenase family enzyme